MIEFRDVTYTVGSESRVIFDRLSFKASRGEVVAIMGRSGCGKTTLLKLVLGMLRPSEGTITVDGNPPSPRGSGNIEIGYLSQSPANTLFPWLTAEQNWNLARRFRGPPGRSDDGHVESVVAALDLHEIRTQRANQLSFGQCKRLAIAVSLSYRPNIALLDEPSVGLDIDIAIKTWGLLYRELRSPDRVSLVATHSFDEAFLIGDRILFIDPERGPSEFIVPRESNGCSVTELLASQPANGELTQLRADLLRLYERT